MIIFTTKTEITLFLNQFDLKKKVHLQAKYYLQTNKTNLIISIPIQLTHKMFYSNLLLSLFTEN